MIVNIAQKICILCGRTAEALSVTVGDAYIYRWTLNL